MKKITEQATVYILQVDYQVADDCEMLERMLEYFGMLYRKYNLEIKQYVFYVSNNSSKMKNELYLSDIQYRFNIINLQDISYREFLDSEIPEEIILAILGNFENQSAESVIEELLDKMEETDVGTFRLEKCVKQLEILSNLCKLQPLLVDLIHKHMALKYDIKQDLRFIQGKDEGKIEGKIEGIRRALKKGKNSIADLAEIFAVSREFVEKIKKEINL